jgi:hypothetical protein
MSTSLVLFLTTVYITISATYMYEGKPGLALAFFCWGMGNIGLLMK